MIKWVIEYSSKSKLEKWFNSLTNQQLSSVAKEMKLLELCGNNLRMPHSKPLKKGIFELRERKFGLRVYYAFHLKKIILLTAGDKTSQQRDILNALNIFEDLKNEKI
jgi:putative addiction module killer protein